MPPLAAAAAAVVVVVAAAAAAAAVRTCLVVEIDFLQVGRQNRGFVG